MNSKDTIAAIATAPGAGGVGIIRVSGDKALQICESVTGKTPSPRLATFTQFRNQVEQIDEGITLFFPGPNSFTGENVIEFQAHGGVVILNLLLQTILSHGARMAEPGEFSQRAFLNGKMDLIQAEAIADLISSTTEQAAMAAQRSLQGEFSEKISSVLKKLIELRVWIEAAIDFPEEEIDFLADTQQQEKMLALHQSIETLLQQAQQGELLNKGIMIGIVGKPNVGKSSLMNLFTQNDTAIVSDVAGTTRDIVKENIHIQGVPVLIIDTAGIHLTEDKIEQEGIKRAKSILQQADILLQVIDSEKNVSAQLQLFEDLPYSGKKLLVYNKSDLKKRNIGNEPSSVSISAKTGAGFAQLEAKILQMIGRSESYESHFSARQRHIHHLQETLICVENAKYNFLSQMAGELVAEDLRQAQENLNRITGEFTSDDLLGEIFSSFCIGK